MDRRTITFAQAEGAEPLPASLQPKEISRELRAKLWLVAREAMLKDHYSPDYGKATIKGNWLAILRDWHVLAQHEMIDGFNDTFQAQERLAKGIIGEGDYLQVFEFFQFVLRHKGVPLGFSKAVNWALKNSRAAYRVVEEKTITPVSNESEAIAVAGAFADLKKAEFGGALEHLRNAAKLLTGGKDADSIRESIHAVESVARLLDPKASASLGPAITALERGGHIHPVLKSGLEKIYGYSNDEKGVRHPLLAEGKANVDEVDAQFMFGACASFISYLIAKARKAQIEIK